MKDKAVAPVIGIMLILVIVVSLLAILNTTTIPDLKAQAEVGHVREVESGFVRLSAALADPVPVSGSSAGAVPIPLGGGEIPLNTLRSSGTLYVMNDTGGGPAVAVTVDGTTFPVRLVAVGYRPTIHFWVDQGYNWSEGYVRVSKSGIETPLEYRDESDRGLINHWDSFRRLLIANESQGKNRTLTNLTLTLTSFEPGNQTFLSGNGIGSIRYTGEHAENATFRPDSIVISVNRSLPGGIRESLDQYVRAIGNDYTNNVLTSTGSDGNTTITFTGSRPDVTVDRRVVRISAG